MSELVTIEGKIRALTGKGVCRKLRANGTIPGNLIEKTKNTMIELDPKWLSKAWKSGKKFNLSLEGKVREVVIHELQISATKRTALHVDLMYV